MEDIAARESVIGEEPVSGHSDGRDSQCARAFARSVEHDDALGVGVPDVEIVHFGVVDIEHGFDYRLVVPLEIGRGQIEGVGVGRLVVLGVVADQERLAGLDQDVVAVARNAENLVDDAVIRPGIFALVERDVLDGGDLRRRDNQQPVGVEILVGVVADLDVLVAVSLVDLARRGEGAGGEERLFDQEIAAVKAVLGLLDIHVGQRRTGRFLRECDGRRTFGARRVGFYREDDYLALALFAQADPVRVGGGNVDRVVRSRQRDHHVAAACAEVEVRRGGIFRCLRSVVVGAGGHAGRQRDDRQHCKEFSHRFTVLEIKHKYRFKNRFRRRSWPSGHARRPCRCPGATRRRRRAPANGAAPVRRAGPP